MKQKFILLSILLIANQQSIGATTNNSTKATAQLVASCTINANNVNFGNILLPMGSQTATSNISVLCNNGAPYTIGMAYGGVYGTGATGNIPMTGAQYYGSIISCYYGGTINGQTYTKTNVIQYTDKGCPTTYTVNTSYNYGVMNGVAHGDQIAYSIQVPNDSSKIWNSGNYSYTSTGTGINQSIPVKATLVPAQSSATYPAPDMYQDTATVNISY